MKEAVLLLLQDLTLLANQLAATNGEPCHFSALTFVDCLPGLILGARGHTGPKELCMVRLFPPAAARQS